MRSNHPSTDQTPITIKYKEVMCETIIPIRLRCCLPSTSVSHKAIHGKNTKAKTQKKAIVSLLKRKLIIASMQSSFSL